MKITPVILLTIFTGGLAFAAPPTVHRSDRYKDLYLNSAITDPPIPDEVISEPENLPDWVLVAVSKYVGKPTQVEVMNIKDRTRIRIPGPEAKEMGFEIKEVKQSRNFIEETVVTLKKGNEVGEVSFDPKFLVLKRAAGPSTAKGKTPNSKTTNSKTNRPPTPGSRPPVPGRSTGGSTKPSTSGKSGSTGSRVPLPSTSSTSTKSSGSSSQKRVRFVKPTK